MNKEDGGQVYPIPASNYSGGECWHSEQGITRRDWLAGRYVERFISPGDEFDEDGMRVAVERAYKLADMVIAEGKK